MQQTVPGRPETALAQGETSVLNWFGKRGRVIAPVLAATALASSVTVAGAADLLVRGSTTLFPFTSRIATELWPFGGDTRALTASIGSGAGLRELCNGTIDVAPSSSALGEIAPVNCPGPGGGTPTTYGQAAVEEWVVAKDAIDPIVQTTSLGGVVTNLTRTKLSNIYNCNINDWNKIVGGISRPIFVVAREVTSGTYQSWLDLARPDRPARRGRTHGGAELPCLAH
jgi:phosphate transport system substrate-binding protein